MTKKTLKELRAGIKKEVPYVDLKPFSHNIISISLMIIAKEYGKEEANKAIRDFDLTELGWKEEK
jgi:hypothetical protein